MNFLDSLANCKLTPEMIPAADDLHPLHDPKRLIEEAAKVDREVFVALLQEDWEARHVGSEA